MASSSYQSPRAAGDGDDDNPLVLETLLRISDILRDYKQLNQRYGLSLVSDDPQYRRPVGSAPSTRPLGRGLTALLTYSY